MMFSQQPNRKPKERGRGEKRKQKSYLKKEKEKGIVGRKERKKYKEEETESRRE